MGKPISAEQKRHFKALMAEAAALEAFVCAPGFNLPAAQKLQQAMADTAAASRPVPRKRKART